MMAVEFKQVGVKVIEAVGIYGELSLSLGKIYIDGDTPIFNGADILELEQIIAKMKASQGGLKNEQ